MVKDTAIKYRPSEFLGLGGLFLLLNNGQICHFILLNELDSGNIWIEGGVKMKYTCEVFNNDISGRNIKEFEELINEYAEQGWTLDKVIPQIDSSSTSSSVNEDYSVDCCSSVSTARNILVFKK